MVLYLLFLGVPAALGEPPASLTHPLPAVMTQPTNAVCKLGLEAEATQP